MIESNASKPPVQPRTSTWRLRMATNDPIKVAKLRKVIEEHRKTADQTETLPHVIIGLLSQSEVLPD